MWKSLSINKEYKPFSDINECQTKFTCHSNATCNNTDGSYICQCNPGYSGDGFNCTGKVTKIISVFQRAIKDWWLKKYCKPSFQT